MRTTTRYRGTDRSECLVCHEIVLHTEMIAAGRDGRCKACVRKATSLRQVFWRYGITWDDYDQLLESQGGVCAVCRIPPGRERFCIDHDHLTGQVRGLVCRSCNLLLSAIDEASPATLLRLLQYVTGSLGHPLPPPLIAGLPSS